MDTLRLKPIRRVAGKLRLPGSKSISNRTLLLAALARGTTELTGVLDADDTRVMREALGALGVRVEALGSEERLRVHGVGSAGGFPVKRAELFLGHAAYAQSLVLAMFMAGMGLGAWVVTRATVRIKQDVVALASLLR